MTIDHLHLLNFKNYEEAAVSFSPRLNVLVGKNGSGKTNLVDAIHFLSFTKGAISTSDQHYIREGQLQAILRGTFTIDQKNQELSSALQAGQKKIFRENGLDYGKLSDHIGKYPVVLVVPDDVDLVKESSEARRRFFDSLISQLDKVYLENLIRYNHCLKQRNSLLKMFAEAGKQDWAMIESYDEVLSNLGTSIFTKREQFINEYLIEFERYYKLLVTHETVSLAYSSGLKTQRFKEGLLETRAKDLALQRTSFGIHRDDFVFSLGSGDLKRLGSQGQQKSFVLAMKLAQLEIIKTHKSFYPILLLDDVFDKLDSDRIQRLLQLFPTFGQIFLTDARPDRTLQLLENIEMSKKIFRIEKGEIAVDE